MTAHSRCVCNFEQQGTTRYKEEHGSGGHWGRLCHNEGVCPCIHASYRRPKGTSAKLAVPTVHVPQALLGGASTLLPRVGARVAMFPLGV